MRILVVGQGIAGTVLAWTLRRRGTDVRIADADFPHRSSSIAAGIINPVTGKRYVKTWRYDDFFPVARSVYQTMEAELGVRIWHDQVILRLLENPQERNDWAARIADPEYAGLLGERPDAGAWAGHLAPGYAVGEIRGAARVDFGALLAAFQEFARSARFFLPQNLRPEEAVSLSGDYDCIVFCEGYRGVENPFFPNLPWQLSKGEAMLIRLKSAPYPAEMLKKTLLMTPVGGDLYWVGASYNWTFDDNGPTDSEQNFLEERLRHFLRTPYEVVQRMGAVRPTVRDRRPFMGAGTIQPDVFIFNGLGTKGALLAPYWAAHLTDHLLSGSPLDREVAVR
ncbi:MAG: FAD-binding oxidoreductase [Saprospiraceae bacterium]|jgi:glycine oxidase|nr:FAD-binding oxidoreductase [Saprospiraceae bacterium]